MKEVTVILPFIGNKVLMQLRDEKSGIDFPGSWGFFGGKLDENETPLDGAKRELEEEIGYVNEDIHLLDKDTLACLDNLVVHSFYCPFEIDLSQVNLREGLDCGLFSLHEIKLKKLYSSKMKNWYPIIPISFVPNKVEKVINLVRSS